MEAVRPGDPTAPDIIGWDIGGANVKAARVVSAGRMPRGPGARSPVVVERGLPLWREKERLPGLLREMAAALDDGRPAGRRLRLGVTMTAELADCFATKREGVAQVLDAVEDAFPTAEVRVYGVDGGFRSSEQARADPIVVAAANWMAGATLAGRMHPDALWLDTGSTTTDVIPIVGGHVVAEGRTDPERLSTGELIYTGTLRTPVCAIVRTLYWRGRPCRVAAEHFAVAADVYRWLERIDEEGYSCETPDGRGRSRGEAAARLARTICADLDLLTPVEVTALANQIAFAQMQQIVSGIRQVHQRIGDVAPRLAIVAGQGAFLGRAAAQEVGLDARELADDLGEGAARATPAVAVAMLLAEEADQGQTS